MSTLDHFIQKMMQEAGEHIAQRTAQIVLQCMQAQHNPVPEAEAPITTEEVCQLLKVSRKTVSDWKAAGKLPFYRKGARVFFYRSEVLSSLEAPKRIGSGGRAS